MSQIKRKPRLSQIEDSRTWIAEAYLALLAESSPGTGISISAIASKAGLSRQTFYRHFSRSEEILDWYLEKQFTLFLNRSSGVPEEKDYHFQNLLLAMDFFRDNEKLITTLVLQKKEHLVLDKLELFTRRFSRNFLGPGSSDELYYREMAFTGSFYMVMKGWLERQQADPPELLFQVLFPFFSLSDI